ncbi:formate/nitrite transporter family protein [Clostridiales bacterium]|nr:formate/nitrite transporter family protein [Clostridiales bacterium]
MQLVKDLKPAEILDTAIETGVVKSGGSFLRLLILGFLAGAFIAFAGAGSNTAAFNLLMDPGTFGLGKVLAGTIFTVGLMMVILTGTELFTGNVLILAAVADKRVSIGRMLRNWGIVYMGNLLGAVVIAAAVYYSGQLGGGDSMLGAFTIKTASAKVSLSFGKAFMLGILCNWLVCVAVWISFSAGSVAGKIGAIFFPIWLFVTCGFEHSIANMYFIPAGILAKANETFVAKSGMAAEVLEHLNWISFFTDNLIPVTLGNIVGGGVFVALVYWLVSRKA